MQCVNYECYVHAVPHCQSCNRNRDCNDQNPCTYDQCVEHRCQNAVGDSSCQPDTWFVQPLLECVAQLGDDQYRAHFGYENAFWTDIEIATTNNRNQFSPAPRDRQQPTVFAPGVHADAFQVEFSGDDALTWSLRSPDGSTRTVAASAESRRCTLAQCDGNDACFDAERLCDVGTCHYGECRYEPKQCDDGDACTINDRCEPSTGACASEPVACDDQNECTIDTCTEQNHAAACVHESIDGCDSPAEPEDCPHEVEIEVNDCSVFEVIAHEHHVYEFCHTSTYLGNRSAVVLDFAPYQSCSLNERGTCSNRYAEHERPDVLCAADAANEGGQCQQGRSHALEMPGFSDKLVWKTDAAHQATFALDEQAGTAHLQGVLVDAQQPSLVLRVDVWFTELADEDEVPSGSPKLELDSQCYVAGGGAVQPAEWRYFSSVNGVITAPPGSAYAGLHITLVRNGPPMQVGSGANGKNPRFGASSWFDWHVSEQPDDAQLHVAEPSHHGDINIDLHHDCHEQLDYCALFGEPQATPANQWAVELSGDGASAAQNITYCRNFTLEDLLNCRSFDEANTRLFDSVQDPSTHLITYSGRLHATTLRPAHCEYHQWSQCGEEVVFDTHYALEVSIDAQGTVSVEYLASDIDFHARWVRNVWLHDGDLKVVLETRVRHIETSEQHPYSARLVDGALDASQETGYPLHLVASTVACRNEDGYCYQEWCLVSEDAVQNHITEFSGLKPLEYTLEVNGEERVRVKVNIDLKARHVGSQAHLSGAIDASLQLYTDRYLQEPYASASGRSFGDCEPVYGVLRLLYQQHLAVRAKQVYVCYALDTDLPAYDREHPHSTGCAAPGAIRRLLYSEDEQDQHYIDAATDQFQFISAPPNGAHQLGFQLQAHAFTNYRQLVQVHWYAEENGGSGALIEGITDYDLGDSSNDDYAESDYEHAHYVVRCPNGWLYDYTYNHCASSSDTRSVWFVLIACIFIVFIVVVAAYLFGWCTCLSSGWHSNRYSHVSVLSLAPQQQRRSAPRITYVDDRDTHVYTQGNGNEVRLRNGQSATNVQAYSYQQQLGDFDV